MSRRVSSFRIITAAFAFIVLAALASVGHSQGLADGGFDPAALDEIVGSVHQVPLTEDMVTRLIASHDDMRKVGAKFPGTELPEKAPVADSGDSDLDALPSDKRQALEAVATKNGFDTLDEWTTVASSVVMSYSYVVLGKKPGALAEAVRLNVAQAERDPTLSDEQKQQTVETYREIGTKLARLVPLKENYELILRMKEQVTPIMDPVAR